MYDVTINLTRQPLKQRDNIMTIIKRSKSAYKLENQNVSINFKTAKVIFNELNITLR